MALIRIDMCDQRYALDPVAAERLWAGSLELLAAAR